MTKFILTAFTTKRDQACSQPKGVEPKMRERKLRSGVNWKGELMQKGVKQTSVKQGLRVHKLNSVKRKNDVNEELEGTYFIT
jgi:hypothetical protein